ncbi:MAG: MgtC/SapB family protein [Fibrobacteria bacterium]
MQSAAGMDESGLFLKYTAAAAIGTLMGMQRENALGADSGETPAGVRTFALTALWGCLAANTSVLLGSPLCLATAYLILGGFLTANFVRDRTGAGLTTGIALLIAFLTGTLAFYGKFALAGALGVVATLYLSLKVELHTFARNLTREEIFATLKFAVLIVIVLPILPHRAYLPPPLDVLNPFEIGLFIVLMSAVGFVGFILAKLLGPARGLGLMGAVGGLVSSTAVTLGFTQRSRTEPALSRRFAQAIVFSWTVMSLRALIVVSGLNLDVAKRIAIPLGAFALAGAVCGLVLYKRGEAPAGDEKSPVANPFEFGPAFKFGLIFVFILTASRAAQYYFGTAGTYVSSLAAGLMDIDAVSISLTRMAGSAGMDVSTAATAILIAILSNSLLKAGFACSAGSRELRRALLLPAAGMIAFACLAAWVASR